VSLDHVTLVVMSTLDLSEYVPVAVSPSVVPSGSDGFCGVITIETSVAAVTVTFAEPLTAPSEAVIVTLPALRPVTPPCEP